MDGKKRIESCLRLSFALLEVLRTKSGFSLSALGQTWRFYTPSRGEAERWHEALKARTLVVLQGFVDDFSLGPVLGKGHFATVQLGINNFSSAQYAVKSIDKSKLALNDTTLVRAPTDGLARSRE